MKMRHQNGIHSRSQSRTRLDTRPRRLRTEKTSLVQGHDAENGLLVMIDRESPWEGKEDD